MNVAQKHAYSPRDGYDCHGSRGVVLGDATGARWSTGMKPCTHGVMFCQFVCDGDLCVVIYEPIGWFAQGVGM
jgi:hypothetical protein